MSAFTLITGTDMTIETQQQHNASVCSHRTSCIMHPPAMSVRGGHSPELEQRLAPSKNMSNMPGTKKINVWLNRVAGKRADFFVSNVPKLAQDVRRTLHPPHLPHPTPPTPSHPHAAQRARCLVPNDLVCDARYTKH